jgi:hypothetical protein
MNTGASSGSVDASNLGPQTFSAQNLLDATAHADGGWNAPVDPGSLAGAGDDY